jgi:hypothetical protein
MPPRRPKSKNTPAKLASRIKRRFRIVLMRKTGQVLGTVEAADAQAAEKVEAIQFELDEQQRRRLLVQELGWQLLTPNWSQPGPTKLCPSWPLGVRA